MAEPILYADGIITVTPSRVLASRAAYAMANVTSVNVQRMPTSRAPTIVMWLLSLVTCGLATRLQDWVILAVVALGLILGVIGIVLLVVARPGYMVRLVTTAGEVRSLGVRDRAKSDKLLAAIQQAMAQRGGGLNINFQT